MRRQSIPDLAEVVDAHLKKVGTSSPGVRALTELLEVVHFTSLKNEEARPLQLRVALVNPDDPDPERPPAPRPYRWEIIRLKRPVPFDVASLAKLAKAADPWSSSLAVYYNQSGQFFVWGLVDQTVHFNTRLVRESESGYPPPGLFQVVANWTADLTVYREHSFVARLAPDTLLKRQNDLFWLGPVTERIDAGMQVYLDAVWRRVRHLLPRNMGTWPPFLADVWISTLCRILISIQRYRHGGALLIATSKGDVDVKYRLDYRRLPKALTNLGEQTIRNSFAREEIITNHLGQKKSSVPAKLYLEESVSENDIENYRNEITGCVRFISSLSCVDGLILAAPDLSIRGFGVEIRTKQDPKRAFLSLRPTVNSRTLIRVDPSSYGTRHRSMMRYCFAHPGSLGFVISQDGEIRAMTRVGAQLIIWENIEVLSVMEPTIRKRRGAGS